MATHEVAAACWSRGCCPDVRRRRDATGTRRRRAVARRSPIQWRHLAVAWDDAVLRDAPRPDHAATRGDPACADPVGAADAGSVGARASTWPASTWTRRPGPVKVSGAPPRRRLRVDGRATSRRRARKRAGRRTGRSGGRPSERRRRRAHALAGGSHLRCDRSRRTRRRRPRWCPTSTSSAPRRWPGPRCRSGTAPAAASVTSGGRIAKTALAWTGRVTGDARRCRGPRAVEPLGHRVGVRGVAQPQVVGRAARAAAR